MPTPFPSCRFAGRLGSLDCRLCESQLPWAFSFLGHLDNCDSFLPGWVLPWILKGPVNNITLTWLIMDGSLGPFQSFSISLIHTHSFFHTLSPTHKHLQTHTLALSLSLSPHTLTQTHTHTHPSKQENKNSMRPTESSRLNKMPKVVFVNWGHQMWDFLFVSLQQTESYRRIIPERILVYCHNTRSQDIRL